VISGHYISFCRPLLIIQRNCFPATPGLLRSPQGFFYTRATQRVTLRVGISPPPMRIQPQMLHELLFLSPSPGGKPQGFLIEYFLMCQLSSTCFSPPNFVPGFPEGVFNGIRCLYLKKVSFLLCSFFAADYSLDLPLLPRHAQPRSRTNPLLPRPPAQWTPQLVGLSLPIPPNRSRPRARVSSLGSLFVLCMGRRRPSRPVHNGSVFTLWNR